MLPQNTFDMSTLNPLDNYSSGVMGSWNYGFNPYGINQYATLRNQTSLSPLSQDTFGARRQYYCEDKVGAHKNITLKQVLLTLGAFAAVVLGARHYISKIGTKISQIFNKDFRALNKQIRKANKSLRATRRQIAKTNELLRRQEAYNAALEKQNKANDRLSKAKEKQKEFEKKLK